MMSFQIARKERMTKLRKKIIKILGAIFIVTFIIILVFKPESIKRQMKSLFSDYTGGLNRTITVYDINGNITKTYTGKFDIEYDDNRIIFDDENGRRHIIFIKTGQLFIDEN